MNRPWQIGVAFGVCLAVVLAAMGWISMEALRLDRAQAQARRQALQEENVRLALWRMESALAPLVAQESARPYLEYRPFYEGRWGADGGGKVVLDADTPASQPSPILVNTSSNIRLHFEFGPDGALTSPQLPAVELRGRALEANVSDADLAAAESRLKWLGGNFSREAIEGALAQQAEPMPPMAAAPGPADRPAPQQQGMQQAAGQQLRNVQEWQARTQQNELMNRGLNEQIGRNPQVYGGAGSDVMRPVWIRGELVLARRVTVDGRERVQGVWLDWPAIRKWLLDGVDDLVPHADLVPLVGDAAEDRTRRLAAVPARLVPGEVPVETEDGLSPVALSLLVAWGAVVLAAAAVGVLLLGTVSLSERRADFVSAVTHELRTPLTTFRMYSEMLAEDMVPDEGRRRRYLATLRDEAERLSHLVENVLAYARLERGRPRDRAETLTLVAIVDRMRDRLAARARQAGMELVVEVAPGAEEATVRALASAVEQILFNLVDNACKYAASAADRRIHLVVSAEQGDAALKVCDHGPGIAHGDQRRLFRPFSKSAREAACSAPGVGLGLALSRRLARDMGGDLVLAAGDREGACFVLRLPRP